MEAHGLDFDMAYGPEAGGALPAVVVADLATYAAKKRLKMQQLRDQHVRDHISQLLEEANMNSEVMRNTKVAALSDGWRRILQIVL